MRMRTVAMIEDAGYQVVEASNAHDVILHLSPRDTRPLLRHRDARLHQRPEADPRHQQALAGGSPGPGVGTHRRLVDDMPERTVGLRKPYAEHDLLNALEAVGTVSLQSRSAQLLRVSNPTRSQAA